MSYGDSRQREGSRHGASYRPTDVPGLEIQVSEDHLTARLNRIDETTPEEVVFAALQNAGISHGVDYQAVGRSVDLAARGQIQYGVAVAQGTPVQLLEPARCRFRDGLEASGRALGRLAQLLQSPSVEVFSGWPSPMVLVSAGDVLAELVPATYEPGRDVYGRHIQGDLSHDAPFQAGAHISVADDGTRYLADTYGGLFGGKLLLLPPVWVAPDLMEACFICLPTMGDNPPKPTLPDLKTMLHISGVTHGANEDAISGERGSAAVNVKPSAAPSRGCHWA